MSKEIRNPKHETVRARLWVAAVLALAVLFPSAAHAAGNRLALCIGNDKYPRGYELSTCINDAKGMAAWLGEVGYEKSEITILTNATKADMVRGFEQLVAQAKALKPQQVFIFYSGHGMEVEDDDGDEKQDDPSDIYDESFVGCCTELDIRGRVDDFVLRDDAFYKYVNEISQHAGQTLIVLDACHSGGLSKGFGGRQTVGRTKAMPQSVLKELLAGSKTKAEPEWPKLNSKSITVGGSKSIQDLAKSKAAPSELAAKGKVIFLTAANEVQEAQAGAPPQFPLSVFSDAYLKAVGPNRAQVAGGPSLKLNRLHEHLVKQVESYGQTPVLLTQNVANDSAFIPETFAAPDRAEAQRKLADILGSLVAERGGAPAKMEAATTKPGPFQVGDKYAFSLTAPEAGHLIMFTVGADNTVQFLYPNVHQQKTEIKAGEQRLVPFKDGLTVVPPTGTEQFYIYLTPTNLFADFSFAAFENELPVGDLEDVLRRNPELRESFDKLKLAKALKEGYGVRGFRVVPNNDVKSTYHRAVVTVESKP